MSDQPESRLQELTRDQCLDLLESQLFLGRIGYVVDGLPIIVPVNFVVDGESVVYSTATGSKLSWLSNHSRVAFQADHGRPADRSGWRRFRRLITGCASRSTASRGGASNEAFAG
jgi:nitroimidazol reductase NimA-like FMN-containing flavoprotein (pyridoxamine 5'-phosphate oxidase superfamily)